MGEDRRLESVFLWGLAVALAVLAVMHWANYFIGPGTWISSWPAIPLTLGAIAAAIGAVAMRRRSEKVRLQR